MNGVALLVVVFAMTAAGCDFIKGIGSKRQECNKVAKIANDATRKITMASSMMKGSKLKGLATANFKNIAKACDTAAEDIGKVDIKNVDLKPKADAYIAVLKEVKGSVDELLAAVEAADKGGDSKPAADDDKAEGDDEAKEADDGADKAKAIGEKIKAAVDKMNPAIEGVNSVCK